MTAERDDELPIDTPDSSEDGDDTKHRDVWPPEEKEDK